MKVYRRFTRLFRERYFCGLDIGATKIKACLGHVRDIDTLELLAVREVETRGLSGASVNDISDLSSAIGEALKALADQTKVRFRDLHLSLGGDLVEVRSSRAAIPLVVRGNKVISLRDVKEARHQARLLGVRIDEEVVQDLVQSYRVDDVNVATDPIGLYGRKLEVISLLVVANIIRLRNLVKAVNQAGYEVNDTIFSGFAMAETMFDRKLRQDGVCLVDLGGRMTQVLILKGGMYRYYGRSPSGGGTVTERIARKLDLKFELAEDIKKSYARVPEEEPVVDVMAEGQLPVDDEEFLIKTAEGCVPVKASLLSEAMESEIKIQVAEIRKMIEASGCADSLGGGIRLVGGGGLLSGMIERIEKGTGLPVTLGRTVPGLSNAISFCPCMSVAELAYKGDLSYMMDTRKPSDLWTGLKSRVEEVFSEYF